MSTRPYRTTLLFCFPILCLFSALANAAQETSPSEVARRMESCIREGVQCDPIELPSEDEAKKSFAASKNVREAVAQKVSEVLAIDQANQEELLKMAKNPQVIGHGNYQAAADLLGSLIEKVARERDAYVAGLDSSVEAYRQMTAAYRGFLGSLEYGKHPAGSIKRRKVARGFLLANKDRFPAFWELAKQDELTITIEQQGPANREAVNKLLREKKGFYSVLPGRKPVLGLGESCEKIAPGGILRLPSDARALKALLGDEKIGPVKIECKTSLFKADVSADKNRRLVQVSLPARAKTDPEIILQSIAEAALNAAGL